MRGSDVNSTRRNGTETDKGVVGSKNGYQRQLRWQEESMSCDFVLNIVGYEISDRKYQYC